MAEKHVKTETAWAAGLFEGEGSISGPDKKPRLQLKMISEESVKRFGEAMGVGKVYGPYGPYGSSMGNSLVWVWACYRLDEVEAACEMLRPLLSSSFAVRLPL